MLACGGEERASAPAPSTPSPSAPAPTAPVPTKPRGIVTYDDGESERPAPVTADAAVEPDAAGSAEPVPRDAPVQVDMKTELRAIKRLLGRIMASRDPAQRRKVACEVAREIDQHAFAAQSVPDPKELTGDTLYAYRNEVDNLSAIAEDMIGHCKDAEPDGVDLDLEQMPRSLARLVQLVPSARRP
jgi:hypothetical protein